MSTYDDYPRRSRSTRTKEPQYVELEDEYIARGPNARELVLRPRDDEYDDYPAEVRRRSRYEDYRSGGGGGRRARSHGYRDDDSYYSGDDYYSDYSPRSRRTRSGRYDDDSSYGGDRKERRKSGVEKTLDDLGLGAIAGAVLGKARSKSRTRRGSSSDRSRREYGRDDSQSRSKDTRKKWEQAAKAAVITAAIEAVRSRKEPGGWAGQKGQRVATAAISAAGIDGLIDRRADRHSKRHIVESVVGGLGVNRLANGPRGESEARGRSMSRDGRARSQSIVDRIRSRSRSVFGRGRTESPGTMDSRGRSKSRGGAIVPLVAAGGVAAAGKAIWDRVRSKSRGRLNRSRSRSVDSEDSYVPSRRPRYAALRDRDGPPQYDGGYDQGQDRDRGRGPVREDLAERNPSGGDARARGARDRSSSSSSSKSGKSNHSCSTTDLENQRKKTRLKELTTALFATAATVHAGHGVYSSMVASEKRHKAVMEGKISREQARKMKSKNIMQDAAAVGIAALGIKSAYAEWKEMTEQRKEKHELEARKRRRKKQAEQRLAERKMQLEAFAAHGGMPPGGQGGQGGPGMGDGGMQQPMYGDANPYQAYAYPPTGMYGGPGAAMGRPPPV